MDDPSDDFNIAVLPSNSNFLQVYSPRNIDVPWDKPYSLFMLLILSLKFIAHCLAIG